MMMLFVALDASATHHYRLYLNGKPDSRLCNFSERAKDRRENQSIEYDDTDLEVSPAYISRLAEAGLKVVVVSRWMNTVVVCSEKEEGLDSSFWQDFDFVDSVLCVKKPTQRTRTFSVARSERHYASDVTDDFMTPHKEINATALYDAGFRGQGKLIAILDGGYNRVNVYMSINKNVVGLKDMYNPGSGAMQETTDNHGTECLSIMSADGTMSLLGTAPEAEYLLIRTEEAETESPLEEDMWIAGAEYADSIGADLISSSLGYFAFDDESLNYKQSLLAQDIAFISRGAQIAATKGIFVCLAAGNERQSAWGAIDFPADAKDVLAVASVNPQLESSSFTSPGFLEPYVKPDVACRGEKSYFLNPETGRIENGNGTSFATPLMCGACASLWSAVPDLTSMQLLDVVRRSSSNFDSPNIFTGYGLPDFAKALSILNVETSFGSIVIEEAKNIDETYTLDGVCVSGSPGCGLFVKNGKIVYFAK